MDRNRPLIDLKSPIMDLIKVNIQDFLQVFQGSGIGKKEDNWEFISTECENFLPCDFF